MTKLDALRLQVFQKHNATLMVTKKMIVLYYMIYIPKIQFIYHHLTY